MILVIHCSVGNIRLVPGMNLTPRKEIQLTRCSRSRDCTKITSCPQRLLLPQSPFKIFHRHRRICSLKDSTRILVAATVGSDVAVEEPNPAVSGDDAGETPEAPESSVGASDPAPSNPAVTSATKSKRPRVVRKSEMPPVKNEELVLGATFTGKVRSIQPFGAFVDFGAFTDGLVHVSRMSDGFVKDVGALVSVGQEVKVRIVEANMESGRISLTMRDSDDASKTPQKKEASTSVSGDKQRPSRKNASRPNQRRDGPQKTSKFVKGQMLNGTVKNLGRAGAFITLPDGEEGFLPVSEESEGFGNIMGNSSLQPGQEVNVRVLRISRGQATLTMKKEEDVEGLNMQLNKGGLYVATNPFEMAFRKNRDIAAFLDERVNAQKFSESSGVSKAANQIEVHEKPATTVDDEQSGVPTATDVGIEVEQSEDETVVGSLSTDIDMEPLPSPQNADAVPETLPEEESSTTLAEAEQSAAEEPSEEDTVVDSISTELDKEPKSAQLVDAIPGTLPEEESSSTLAEAEQGADEEPSEEEAVVDSLSTELDKEPVAAPLNADAVPESVPEEESSTALVGSSTESVEGNVSVLEEKFSSAEEPIITTPENAESALEMLLEDKEGSAISSSDSISNKDFIPVDMGDSSPLIETEKMSSPKGSITTQNEASANDSPANLGTDDASSMVDEAKEQSDDNKSATLVEVAFLSEGSLKDEVPVTNDISKTVGVEVSDCANEIVQGEDVSSKSLSGERGSSADPATSADSATAKEAILVSEAPGDVHAENLPLEGSVLQEVFTNQSESASVDNKSQTEAPQLVENEMPYDVVKDSKLEAPDASNGQTGIPSQASTVKANISPALVKQLREETGAGMMDCKKALAETGGDIVKAQEFLRKKGLASADKKASRATAEGRIGSYIHDNRIGVLIEVNCETDFVSRGEIFKELVDDLAMQVAACPQVRYMVPEDVPEEIINKEREIEMQKEDLLKKPAQIRSKIVDGRIRKRLEEFALLEQPYIKNDKVVVKDWVKQTIATIGENIKVKRFVRHNLGEGLEKKIQDFAAEVAAQTAGKSSTPAAPKDKPAETKEAVEKPPAVMVSAALVKQLREETGAGMMDCKKALTETGGDLEKAQEYLRKKGLSSADKKSSRLAAEGRISSYIHDTRIGTLIEVNCETDFVGRSEKFKELVDDLAMQVVACPQVEFVSVDEISEDVVKKEKEIEMQREDLKSKPENIREKIVEGRISKRLGELALLEQPFIKDDSILVKDLVKQTVAALGENIKVRRFVRYTLGENKD